MKKVIVLMAVLLSVNLLGSFAQARTCYNLAPFSDVLKLGVVNLGPDTNLFGNWITTSYTLPIVGAREANLGGGPRRVSVNGTNNTADFGGNPICAIDGTVGGAWAITCVGGANGTFTVSGSSLSPVSCAAAKVRQGMEAGRAGK